MRANNHGEGGIFALYALVVLVVFGAIEAVFFVSSLGKFIHGGYVAVIMALILFFIMLVWHRGTQLERQYCVPLHFADYVQPLGELHDDPEIPRLTHNLVYLDNSRDFESIDFMTYIGTSPMYVMKSIMRATAASRRPRRSWSSARCRSLSGR